MSKHRLGLAHLRHWKWFAGYDADDEHRYKRPPFRCGCGMSFYHVWGTTRPSFGRQNEPNKHEAVRA